MVVAVVTPVVFCDKATEKQNKNKKTSCLLPKFLFVTFIVKHIVIHISLIVHGRARVVVWPDFCPMDPGILGIARKLMSL